MNERNKRQSSFLNSLKKTRNSLLDKHSKKCHNPDLGVEMREKHPVILCLFLSSAVVVI